MENLLTRKLEGFGPLPEADKRLLDEVIRDVREISDHQDLGREGDAPSHVNLILEGFACRYKLLPNGSRHIMAYLVPGDFCDLHVFILKAMDHAIGTLSRCKVVKISRTRRLANGDAYELPITQLELADTMGMTGVHMNRVIQRLRAEKMITLKGKNLVLLDAEALKRFSGFNPNYLHLAEPNGVELSNS